MKKKAIKAQVQPVVKCNHYWLYPHVQIQGRKKDETAVVRYCYNCKKQQMAFASNWGNVPKSYDIEDLIT